MPDAPDDPTAADGATDRLLRAALRCIERQGLAATSLEDVAREAELSRATVYRRFPGGREQLVRDAVAHEVGRFLEGLGTATSDQPDLAARLRAGLIEGRQALDAHRLLQQLLRSEPEVLLRELNETGPVMLAVVRDELRRELARVELAPGVDLDGAAEHLARMFLSYLGSSGRWDLRDESEVDRLVRTYLLAGVVASP